MQRPARLVLASANRAKAAELAQVLSGVWGDEVELVPRPSEVAEVAEDAGDFEGNARLKAVALCSATGDAALADDSGLEVEGLAGDPGVRSARFAGPDADDAANRAALVSAMAGVPAGDPRRRARFVCAIVLRFPDGGELVAEGYVAGTILPEERGEGGFGYDRLFVPDEGDGRTFAEMSPADKHAISHRGRALAALAAELA